MSSVGILLKLPPTLHPNNRLNLSGGRCHETRGPACLKSPNNIYDKIDVDY